MRDETNTSPLPTLAKKKIPDRQERSVSSGVSSVKGTIFAGDNLIKLEIEQ